MLFKKKVNKHRFIEIDFLRGIAIIHMIVLHLFWDLDYYNILPINSLIESTNVIVQVNFLTIVGICLAISFNKKKENTKKFYEHLVKRGVWIFSLGLILTVVTLIVMPDRPIFFGVLHCIGLCIILSIPFLKLSAYNFPIAILLIILGIIIGSFSIQNPSILHLVIGFYPANIWTYTIDYFPIFPWFGVILLGVSIGNILYKNNERRFSLPDILKYSPVQALAYVGKKSLIIYLFHQPAIFGIITFYTML